MSFNENGDIIEWNFSPSHDEFFAEFGFVNAKYLEMVDFILQDSVNQPVIIFQADHGSTYGRSSSPKNDARYSTYTPLISCQTPSRSTSRRRIR